MILSPYAIYNALQKDLSPYISQSMTNPCEKVSLIPKRIARQKLYDEFLKKMIPKESSIQDRVAFDTFEKSNERCRTYLPPIRREDVTESDMILFGEFSKILEDFFLVDLGSDVELSYPNIALNARCGPGSAVGAQSNSHYGKLYSGPLTATSPSLVTLYKADISLWPEESNAEIIRQENFGSVEFVSGSRSSFVPKTEKTSRMICVEPTLNMFYQLGLGEILTKRLKRFFGIDLATQPSTNRYMAYIGSLVDSSFGDGFATIDLSSASDSLSLQLASEIIPPEWLSAILEFRSTATSISVGKDVVQRQLYMISTMGNGFTFPLQTAIFAAAASAAVSMDDSIRTRPKSFNLRFPGQFSVFGDDIAIHAAAAPRLLRLLYLMGCEPNEEKSFLSGKFRESCGHDYFDGHNVRPVYLRKLDTQEDLAVLANLLAEWCVNNETELPLTMKLLWSHYKHQYLVPMGESEDAGIRVPYRLARARSGYPLDRGCQSLLYYKRLAHPRRMRFSDGVVILPKGAKRHIYNPSGLLMSFLKGEVRGGCIALASNKTIYRTKRVVSPNWDYRIPTLEDGLIPRPLSPREFATRLEQVWEGVIPHSLAKSRKRERGPKR
jgi:hypothetical protein